jgi:two-component system, OmpR family, sensor histidine kinase TctE
VRVLADPFGKALVLQVEDSGPGIAPAERTLVFQPFYRTLGTEADRSGLGLSIVQEIATQHNATISIDDTRAGHVPPGLVLQCGFWRGRQVILWHDQPCGDFKHSAIA